MLDPEAGTASVQDVLVSVGKVVKVGQVTCVDAVRLDVTGLVVGPGFIDLHSHVHSIAGPAGVGGGQALDP